jgi:hypothetical protein
MLLLSSHLLTSIGDGGVVNITNVHSWFANFVYYLLYAIVKKLSDVTSIAEIFYNGKASIASSFCASKFLIFLP